jgi:NAD(P)-dependent dehydrogenase (short-subunit alcohol dehydrogenase family)
MTMRFPSVRQATNRLVNPRGESDRGRLRAAVAGKVTLVTGASHGLGEAVAGRLGAAGSTVLAVARSKDRLADLVAQIERQGGKAVAYPVDLSELDAVDALAREVLRAHGHVDIVISNAGKSIRRSLDLSYDRPQDFQRTIDVNYLGPVRLLLGLLPSMRERGQGHIVNISTVGVRTPPAPRWASYQASKAAFDVWLRSAAAEIRADGVDASTVYMPLMFTRMSAPTPTLRRLPGLHPDEAADVVARAIVRRPRSIAPWWLGPAELTGVVARGPVGSVLGLAYRLTTDSSSARR